MERNAPAKYPIHDLLKQRWSPRAFADRDVEPEKLRSLFEAAQMGGIFLQRAALALCDRHSKRAGGASADVQLFCGVQSELGQECAGDWNFGGEIDFRPGWKTEPACLSRRGPGRSISGASGGCGRVATPSNGGHPCRQGARSTGDSGGLRSSFGLCAGISGPP